MTTIAQQPDATAHAADTHADAVAAAIRGWAVFPCRPGDKRPMVDRWEQRACSDPGRVAQYWPDGANVGIACGPSGLVVVDLDCHEPLPADWQAVPGVTDGRDVFAQLCEWAGADWPATYWVATPTGGWHLYFDAPAGQPVRNSAGMLGPGVDIRAAGGYVVGAGSVVDERAYPDKPSMAALVKGGRAYEILDGRAPAPLPGWLRHRLTPKPPPERDTGRPAGDGPANLAGLVQTVRESQPGQQTNTLVWAAFRLRDEISRGRASSDDAEHLVRAALEAGMQPERYVRYQVQHVLGGNQ